MALGVYESMMLDNFLTREVNIAFLKSIKLSGNTNLQKLRSTTKVGMVRGLAKILAEHQLGSVYEISEATPKFKATLKDSLADCLDSVIPADKKDTYCFEVARRYYDFLTCGASDNERYALLGVKRYHK